MKHSENVLNGASVGVHLHEVVVATKARILSLARNIADASTRVMFALQVSRMTSALATLSDEQLGQIGLQRKDINDYAHKLITYEYDGL